MDGDSIEQIARDFLLGHEQVVNAFNRLLAIRAPMVPVAMEVRAVLVEESAHVEQSL